MKRLPRFDFFFGCCVLSGVGSLSMVPNGLTAGAVAGRGTGGATCGRLGEIAVIVAVPPPVGGGGGKTEPPLALVTGGRVRSKNAPAPASEASGAEPVPGGGNCSMSEKSSAGSDAILTRSTVRGRGGAARASGVRPVVVRSGT